MKGKEVEEGTWRKGSGERKVEEGEWRKRSVNQKYQEIVK